MNWAKVCTRCPLCKIPFDRIFKVKGGEKIDRILVKPKGINDDEEEGDENELIEIENTDEACYVCNEIGDTQKLMVCDHCNFRVCHNSCLPEPIDWIPEEDFYCSTCCEAHNLKNDFTPPQQFNEELYLQLTNQQQEEQSNRRGRRRTRVRIERNDGNSADERDEVYSQSIRQSAIGLSLFIPEDVEKKKEERRLRLEMRQQMLEGVTPVNLPQKYKPSPAKKFSNDKRGQWRRIRRMENHYNQMMSTRLGTRSVVYNRRNIDDQSYDEEEDINIEEEDMMIEEEEMEQEKQFEEYRRRVLKLEMLEGRENHFNQLGGGVHGVEAKLTQWCASPEPARPAKKVVKTKSEKATPNKISRRVIQKPKRQLVSRRAPIRPLRRHIKQPDPPSPQTKREYPKRAPKKVVDFPYEESMFRGKSRSKSVGRFELRKDDKKERRNLIIQTKMSKSKKPATSTLCNLFEVDQTELKKVVKRNPRNKNDEIYAISGNQLYHDSEDEARYNRRQKTKQTNNQKGKFKAGSKPKPKSKAPARNLRTKSSERARERTREQEKYRRGKMQGSTLCNLAWFPYEE